MDTDQTISAAIAAPTQPMALWRDTLEQLADNFAKVAALRMKQSGSAYDTGRHDAAIAAEHELRKFLAEIDGSRAEPTVPVPTKPSPTAGMNIAQRILHVGGRNNAAGYVEFGSIQAVEALVRQVLRDQPAREAAQTVPVDEDGVISAMPSEGA